MIHEQFRAENWLHRRKKLLFIGVTVVAMIVLVGIIVGINQMSALPKPIAQPQPIALSATELEQARQQFKADLQRFEQDIEASLQYPGLQFWDGEAVTALLTAKGKALDAFGAGDYPAAVTQLGEVSEQGQLLISRWDQTFDQFFAAASGHFEQNNIRRAILQIDQALNVKPAAVDALALKARLDILPEVEELLGQAKVAQIENKLQREMDLLLNVLRLDPVRQTLNSRVSVIKETLKDQRFTAKVQNGLQAIAQGDIQAAVNALNMAKSVDPSRSELALLSSKIGQAQADSALDRAVASVDLLIREDNWQQVWRKTGQLLSKYKDNSQFREANTLAGQLLQLEGRIEKYLANPQRLVDANVGSHANQWLKDNTSLAKNSVRIHEKIQQLKTRLDILSEPVEVMLRSDGKTDIIVVGKGHVGKIKSYQVQLSPGHYVLEGRRAGYRSTRVEVEITPGIVNQQVQVICNERI